MSTKTQMVQELLGVAQLTGQRLSVSRARRLVTQYLNEPDPVAYCLTYLDPVGEQATNRAMYKRKPTC